MGWIVRRDDAVAQAELPHRFGDVPGLGPIERPGQAGLDVAERAGARAGIAHDHEGGVLLLRALADVGTAGFLAHRMQRVGADDAARLGEAGRARRLDPDPRGLAQYRRFRPMRLFRMARPGRLDRVEDNGHEMSSTLLTGGIALPQAGEPGALSHGTASFAADFALSRTLRPFQWRAVPGGRTQPVILPCHRPAGGVPIAHAPDAGPCPGDPVAS